MFDIGMTELLVIGIVALIVVGPKDLPVMFRTLGRFTGKMRGMARDFQRAMEDAADDAGVKDIQKDLRKLSNPKRYGLDKLNEAADSFKEWDPSKSAKGRPKGPATEAMTKDRQAKAAAVRDGAGKTSVKEPAPEVAGPEPAAPAKSAGTSADTPLTQERDG